MRATHTIRSALVGAAASLGVTQASAQELTQPAANPLTFEYVQAPQANGLRIALEELAILLLGVGYYFLDHEVNSVDWTYDYEWSTLREKLTGRGTSFDTNHFQTNTLAHTGAGSLYYIIARGNHLTVGESLALATLSSTLWELLAEYRERMSINDMVTTPLAGFAFGEAMTQVGALFDRGCDRPLFRTLGSVFGPSRSLHDWVDGAQLKRAVDCDANGFSRVGWHRIRLTMSTALATGGGSGWGRSWLDGNALVDVAHLANVTPREQWTSFGDGNVARLQGRVRGSATSLHDVRLQARSIPVGFHRSTASHSLATVQREAVLGLGASVLYSEHRYAEGSPRDPFFVVEAPALYGHWRWKRHAHEFFASLVVAPTMAAVGVFALSEYAESHDLTALTPVAAKRGYNHALGVVVNPEVRWSSPWHELGVNLRLDRLFPIRSLIGDERSGSDISGNEVRRSIHASLAIGDSDWLRFRSDLEVDYRQGTIDTVQRSATELTWANGIELRY